MKKKLIVCLLLSAAVIVSAAIINAASPAGEILYESVSVGNSFTVNVYAEIDGNYSWYVDFSRNGKTERTEGKKQSDGSLCFSYEELTPQCLGDEISIRLICVNGGKETTVESVSGFSVKKYCEVLYGLYEDADTREFLADILKYGAQAQKYTGYRSSDADLATYGLDWPEILEQKYFDGSKLGSVSRHNEITADARTNRVTAAGLILGNFNNVYFDVSMENGTEYRLYEATGSGYKDVTSGSVSQKNGKSTRITTPALAAVDNGTVFRVELRISGKAIYTFDYSAETYISRKFDSDTACGSTTLGSFLQTLSNYGNSAENYVLSQKHSFGAWTVTKHATENACGERHRKCSDCGLTETQNYELGRVTLKNGSSGLNFVHDGDSYYVTLTEGEKTIGRSEYPAEINLNKAGNIKSSAAGRYGKITCENGKITAVSDVTAGKTAFTVTDVWSVSGKKGFIFSRNVRITANGGEYSGYASRFAIAEPSADPTRNKYEYFIPSVIYRDNAYMASSPGLYGEATALLSDLSKANEQYVKETCIGLPMAMVRTKSSGNTVALQHLDPELSGNYQISYSAGGTNLSERYGSLGYDFRDGLEIAYTYPAQIGPDNYVGVQGTIYVYHPIAVGGTQSYTLALFGEKTDRFQTSVIDSYKNAYSLENPEISHKFDMEDVLEDNRKLLSDLYVVSGSGAGMPFACSVLDKKLYYSTALFENGYVGAQTLCGRILYCSGDSTQKSKGKKILDFWATVGMNYAVPPVEWYGGNSFGGTSQLRKLCDGYEALLDAYLYGKANGETNDLWKKALDSFADVLVSLQNSDGSFYRKYSTGGSALSGEENLSKLNSCMPVKFLCGMYKETGNEKYKAACVKAGEYCYNYIYGSAAKFVGATDDGYLRIDRESGIYASDCFAALYDLTGEKKYAAALEYSLIYTMSFVYCYDYAVPAAGTTGSGNVNPMKNGGLIGMSTIASVGTNIDTFMASRYTEFFKEYLRTGEKVYLDMALMLEHNTKLTTDYDGRLGYLSPAMCCEATNVFNFCYWTAEDGVWLPWISGAFCKPILDMKDKGLSPNIEDALKNSTVKELRIAFGV